MTPRVILIGPPGAGKSSIGLALAKRLKVSFKDTDHLIEQESGKRVSQIFIVDGEAAFREIEKRVCERAIREEEGVLALGGGAVLTPETRAMIVSTGSEIIFLDVSLKVAAPRIGFNRDRPLLLKNPRQQWQKLMDLRRPIYEEMATLICDVGSRSVSEIVNELLPKVAH
jgi:shikimate kinase